MDFGNPRWIIGLMFMANTLHPDIFNFDIKKEAQSLYAIFYHIEFKKNMLNLSFGKPSMDWEWASSPVM
jgi:hypothetical protein